MKEAIEAAYKLVTEGLSSVKVYLYAAAVLALLVLGAGLSYEFMHASLVKAQNDAQTARAQVEALTVAQAARDAGDAAREAARASTTQKTKENHEALDQAASGAGDWGSVPVPDGVARVLRDAARPGPTSAP